MPNRRINRQDGPARSREVQACAGYLGNAAREHSDDKRNKRLFNTTERVRLRTARAQGQAIRDWIERLEAALMKVALLLDREPAFTPVFERLEAELEAAERARDGTDAQRRARALLDQKANRPTISALSSKVAPLP